MIKLLYPFANVMGLFFPVGRLEQGGTCEFATEECLKKCCAHAPGTGMIIGFERKRTIFNHFLTSSPDEIVSQILTELKNAECEIFTWFASGDCPSFLTDKYYLITKALDQNGIIQTGVTRNKNLWEKCHCKPSSDKLPLSEKFKILLTIEDIQKATKAGLYSIPNYEIGAIDIVQVDIEKVLKHTGCGGGYYEDHVRLKGKDDSHLKLDCKACYKDKTGCFTIMETGDGKGT